jgi:hypothetical protein
MRFLGVAWKKTPLVCTIKLIAKITAAIPCAQKGGAVREGTRGVTERKRERGVGREGRGKRETQRERKGGGGASSALRVG